MYFKEFNFKRILSALFAVSEMHWTLAVYTVYINSCDLPSCRWSVQTPTDTLNPSSLWYTFNVHGRWITGICDPSKALQLSHTSVINPRQTRLFQLIMNVQALKFLTLVLILQESLYGWTVLLSEAPPLCQSERGCVERILKGGRGLSVGAEFWKFGAWSAMNAVIHKNFIPERSCCLLFIDLCFNKILWML